MEKLSNIKKALETAALVDIDISSWTKQIDFYFDGVRTEIEEDGTSGYILRILRPTHFSITSLSTDDPRQAVIDASSITIDKIKSGGLHCKFTSYNKLFTYESEGSDCKFIIYDLSVFYAINPLIDPKKNSMQSICTQTQGDFARPSAVTIAKYIRSRNCL